MCNKFELDSIFDVKYVFAQRRIQKIVGRMGCGKKGEIFTIVFGGQLFMTRLGWGLGVSGWSGEGIWHPFVRPVATDTFNRLFFHTFQIHNC